MLTIEDLSKSFRDTVALEQLNLHIAHGQSYGLLGRNGAGKTTTIRIILDIIQASSGVVKWKGIDIRKNKPTRGYLPEERGLYPKSTIMDQLLYFAQLEGMSKVEARKAVMHWLERFDVAEYVNRKPEQLSKGNQQKVQIAMTLIHDPELVIFDEPFSGLDPVNANLLCDVIDELRRNGKTMLFSSHQMMYVERFCDEITILKKGRTIVQGAIEPIKKSRDRNELMVEPASEADGERLVQWIDDRQIAYQRSDKGYLLKGSSMSRDALIPAIIQAGIQARKLEWVLPSLHDIFVQEAGE